MRRRRGRTGLQVSLFPFLTILACVIGALTLLIAGMTVAEMSSGRTAAEEYVIVTQEAERDRRETTRLQSLVSQAQALHKLLEEARREMRRLEDAQRMRDRDRAKALELSQELARLRKRITELESELRKVQQEIAKLRKQIARRKESKGPPVHVGYAIPGGGTPPPPSRPPKFVECTSDSLVFLPDGKRVSKWGIPWSPTLRSLARASREGSAPKLVFLVRPNGVKTFQAAYLAAKKVGANPGYLPAPGYGPINLEAFGVTGGRGTPTARPGGPR